MRGLRFTRAADKGIGRIEAATSLDRPAYAVETAIARPAQIAASWLHLLKLRSLRQTRRGSRGDLPTRLGTLCTVPRMAIRCIQCWLRSQSGHGRSPWGS